MKSKVHIFFENALLSTLTFFKVLIKSNFFLSYNKSIKRNKNLLIIGNGPSFKESINRLSEENKSHLDLLAVNFFANSDFFLILKPLIYVISAPEFWISNVDENYITSRNKLFKSLADNVEWNMILYVPYEAKKIKFWQNVLKTNPHIKIDFYNNTPIEGFPFLNTLYYNNNLGMFRPHNVIIPSLFISIGLEYENIYLIGVEHSWLQNLRVNQDNEVQIKQEHFYDQQKAQYKPMKKMGSGSRKLFEILDKLYLTFKGYFEIKKYVSTKNTRIYNLTTNSFIDAFEKFDIEKLNLYND